MPSAHDPLRKIQAQHVPDAKADIGSVLKAARVKRGQSLEAVVSHTRIPKKFVEALEANHLEEFPALAYLRGFLKTYCDYLELDFEPLWKQLAPAPVPAPSEGQGPAGHSPAAASQAPAHGVDAPTGAIAALAVAAALAALLALSLRRGAAPAAEERAAPTPLALQPVHGPTQTRLAVEFRDDAWISVSSEGKILFEGRAPRNARQEWTAPKALLMRTNSPETLRLTLNGAKFALPAPDSEGRYRIETP